MSKYVVTKLDRRMNGHVCFTHRLDFYGPYNHTLAMMHEMRVWLWDTYGPGAELATAHTLKLQWAWDTDKDCRRIYLNPEILAVVQLKWA